MHADVKRARTAIKHIDGAWVRRWKDGTMWAGLRDAEWRSKDFGCLILALQVAGFAPTMANNKPGTAGEFILELLV